MLHCLNTTTAFVALCGIFKTIINRELTHTDVSAETDRRKLFIEIREKPTA